MFGQKLFGQKLFGQKSFGQKSVLIVFCGILVGWVVKTTDGAMVTYSIGNSLTANLINPYRLAELAASAGQTPWNADYHIRANSSLSSFVAQPDLPTDSRFVPYSTAFAATHYDAVMLEPSYGATIRQEVAAATQLVHQLRLNSANADTRILIYAIWPQITLASPFQSTWDRQDFTLDTPFAPSAMSYELFMQQLRIDVPNAEIIPAGHVFDAVIDTMNSPGGLPGLTSVSQLIGDGIHATNAGGYLAGIAAYSTLYRLTPVGLGNTLGFNDPLQGYVLPAASVPIVQTIALGVVSSVPEPNSWMLVVVVFGLRSITVRSRRVGKSK